MCVYWESLRDACLLLVQEPVLLVLESASAHYDRDAREGAPEDNRGGGALVEGKVLKHLSGRETLVDMVRSGWQETFHQLHSCITYRVRVMFMIIMVISV
jgi:hypothetical protein